MQKVHVLNDVAYLAKAGGGSISGINEINLLAPGALAIINDKGVVVPSLTLPATSLDDVKWVQFAVGMPAGRASLSDPIYRDGADYNAESYSAGVAQVDFLGNDGGGGTSLNLPTLTAGDEAFIKVIDKSSGMYGPADGARRIWNASYLVKTGDAAADILAGLVASLNAIDDCPVTIAAVAGNDGISFTADAVGTVFDVGFGGVLQDADIVTAGTGNSVVPKQGTGTATLVADMLAKADPEFGQGNRVHLAEYYYSRQNNLSTSGTYDIYTYAWGTTYRQGPRVLPSVENTYVIAMPDGASTITQANFESLMAVIFATDSASQTESGGETAV